MRQQPSFRIPDQFFAREPACALHKAAFDLAARDPEINRVAGVMQNIDAPHVHHAGEAIDFDFRHRRADREIVETVFRDPLRDRNGCPGVR